MNQYEITFIVDPVLSGEEIKATAQTYVDQLKNEGCTIVHVDEMGLRQLAYPINKRTSGVYFCIEFQSNGNDAIPVTELALRRDERIVRFLTVKLDKYGIKYNEDKRNGLIGTVKKKKKKEDSRRDGRRDNRRDGRRDNRRDDNRSRSEKQPARETPVKEAPAKPKAEQKKEEEE